MKIWKDLLKGRRKRRKESEKERKKDVQEGVKGQKQVKKGWMKCEKGKERRKEVKTERKEGNEGWEEERRRWSDERRKLLMDQSFFRLWRWRCFWSSQEEDDLEPQASSKGTTGTFIDRLMIQQDDNITVSQYHSYNIIRATCFGGKGPVRHFLTR